MMHLYLVFFISYYFCLVQYSFCLIKTIILGNEEAKLSAAGGTFAYHTVCHNHSYSSMDYTSKLIKRMFKTKFGCARTKTEAIVNNILAPWCRNVLKEELENIYFISVSIDTSNHKSIKIFPILIRYFSPETGVHMKVLEISSVKCETSTALSEHVISVLQKYNLVSKFVCLSADNTNSMFGGAKRRGVENVYRKLQKKSKQTFANGYWMHGTYCS